MPPSTDAEARFLSEPSIDLVRRVLRSEAPEIAEGEIRPLSQGRANYALLVGGIWVVRFARNARTRHRQEAWATKTFSPVSPIPIPFPSFVGPRTAFLAHRLLPGERLGAIWGQCTAHERALALQQLSEFCAALHQTLSVEVALENGLETHRPKYERARAHTGMWRRRAQDALGRVGPATDERVIHNDLHGENILVDPETHLLSGVIDFGDVALGDPCFDLEFLLEFGPDSAEAIANWYRDAGGQAVDPQRLRDIFFLHTLDDLEKPEISDPDRQELHQLLQASRET